MKDEGSSSAYSKFIIDGYGRVIPPAPATPLGSGCVLFSYYQGYSFAQPLATFWHPFGMLAGKIACPTIKMSKLQCQASGMHICPFGANGVL